MVSGKELNGGINPGRREFSQEAINEANLIVPAGEALSGRRRVDGIAIDPEGTPDADDAISVTIRNGTYLINVSIIDIASFVPQGGAIDQEARERFATCYLGPNPRNNIPMLPKVLSENRLSMSSIWGRIKPTITTTIPVTSSGEVGQVRIERTSTLVTRAFSHRRADIILKQDEGPIANMLRNARQAAVILSRKRGSPSHPLRGVPLRTRFERQFNVPEDKYASSRIVQEFMILHNATLAKLFRDKGLSLIYRNHTPSKEALAAELERAEEIIEEATTSGQEVDQEGLWQSAYFDIEPRGHAGLGFDQYARLSSPLRCFDHLVNQRLQLSDLLGKPPPYTPSELRDIAAVGNSIPRK